MIVIKSRDIPPGMTAEQVAALVCGIERASHDMIVVVNTVDDDAPEAFDPPSNALASERPQQGEA
jgi:hypothetical protein